MVISTGVVICGVVAVSAIGLVLYLEKRRNDFYKAFVENKEAKTETPFEEFAARMTPHTAERSQPSRRPIPPSRSSNERRQEARRQSVPGRSGATERRSHVEECSWANNPANSISPFNQAAQNASPSYDSTPSRCSPSYGGSSSHSHNSGSCSGSSSSDSSSSSSDGGSSSSSD